MRETFFQLILNGYTLNDSLLLTIQLLFRLAPLCFKNFKETMYFHCVTKLCYVEGVGN